MAVDPPYQLGDDLPKENPWKDDRLGYAPFAKQVSKVIVDLQAPNGFVIGLHGQWGSGKSTVMNFIAAYLRKHNEECGDARARVELIDFRPWIVAGHQDLVAAFFKVLSEFLGPNTSWLSRKWKQFVRVSRGATDNLIDSVATIAVTIDPTAGVASKATGTVIKKSLGGLIDRFLKDPSLQSAHENLRRQLAASGRRFLVTIDDLDRLEDHEVKAIMQMVKTVGRLPNVTYLLAYDRKVVWDSLDGQGRRADRPGFAEKIVQQEIELPKPSKGDLLLILDEEISFITGPTEDSSRWAYLLRDGVHRWMRSPRDVVRLSNAVKFSWPALQGEMDSQDLIAMDGLRLFDEHAFNWIRDNRDFLFGDGSFAMAGEDFKKAAAALLKNKLPEQDKQQVLHVIAVLFPQAAKWLEDRVSREESYVDVIKRRGVGSEAGYDAYFGFHPSAESIPKSSVDAVMNNLDDVEAILAVAGRYIGKQNSRGEPMIGKLLDEIRAHYKSSTPAQPTQDLLDALFRIGDDVIAIDSHVGAFSLAPRSQISFLIRSMLEQWGIDGAGEHLIEAFRRSGSPAFCADIYVDRARELDVFESSSRETPCITSEDFGELGKLLLPKILSAARDGTLARAPFFFDIARSWVYLGDPEEARQWLAHGMMESGAFMAKVAKGLVTYSHSSKGSSYRMREDPDFSLYDRDVMVKAGMKHLADSQLTEDQRKLIAEVVNGVRVPRT